MFGGDDMIDLARQPRQGLGKLAVLTTGTCTLPDQTDQSLIHGPARRGTFSFSQGLTGLRMDQVQQVADPLIVVDRGPLLGRQRPGPGFLGEDVHSLAVARLEVDLNR